MDLVNLKPETQLIKRYAEAFDILFNKAENELKNYFANQHFSQEVVENRVDLLEKYYGTGLKRHDGLYEEVIDFLINENERFDSEIRNGCIDTVSRIAHRDAANCFSFATKYCSFLNPNNYPIYDSYVMSALNWFQYKNGVPFYIESRYIKLDQKRQEYDYEGYRSIINAFMNYFALIDEQGNKKVSYKELDKFLWIVGKNI